MARPSGFEGPEVPPVLPSIPLSAEPERRAENESIGELVKDVTAQVSTLVRSEVELARTEVTAEVKKGLQGSVLFLAALTVLLFSLFFFFFFLAELLAVYIGRPAAFGFVFVLMLLAAGFLGLLGYLRVKKIRKPERTIESVRETAATLSRVGRAEGNGHQPGYRPE